MADYLNVTTMNMTQLDPSSPNPTSLLIYKATGLGILIITSLVFNSVSLVVLRRMREISVVTRVFLTSMTAADIAITVIFIPIFVSTIADKWIFGERCCAVIGYFAFSFSAIYYLALPLVNLERFIAIVLSFRYPSLVTVSRARSVVVCAWGLPIITSFIVCSGREGVRYNPSIHLCVYASTNSMFLTLSLLGPVLVVFTAIMCVILCHVTGRHARQIDAQERIAQTNAANNLERKTLITFFIMTTCFTICLIPQAISNVSYNANIAAGSNAWFLCFAQQLALSNTILNVLVYYWRTTAFRKALTDTFADLKGTIYR